VSPPDPIDLAALEDFVRDGLDDADTDGTRCAGTAARVLWAIWKSKAGRDGWNVEGFSEWTENLWTNARFHNGDCPRAAALVMAKHALQSARAKAS